MLPAAVRRDGEEPQSQSKYSEIKAISTLWPTLTQASFMTHPIFLREIKPWADHGWSVTGVELASSSVDSNVRLACAHGHEKTVGALWFLDQGSGFGRPAMFKCRFCDGCTEVGQLPNPSRLPYGITHNISIACFQKVMAGFLAYKRTDYVMFNPRPSVCYEFIMGRVSKVNPKSGKHHDAICDYPSIHQFLHASSVKYSQISSNKNIICLNPREQ